MTHQKAECGDLYKDVFVDGVKEFTHNNNIMRKILLFTKSNKSFVYPYFAAHDFESLACNIDKKKGENTIILNKQVPISFSFGTNMNDDINHFVDKNTNTLIKLLVESMYKAQNVANEKVMKEYFE